MSIEQYFEDLDDFEVFISTAIHNAKTDWEKRFCNDLHNRYLIYGSELIIRKKAADKVK